MYGVDIEYRTHCLMMQISVCMNKINSNEYVCLRYIQKRWLLTLVELSSLLSWWPSEAKWSCFSVTCPLPSYGDPQSKGHCQTFQQITKMTNMQPDIHPHRCALLHVYAHTHTNPVLCSSPLLTREGFTSQHKGKNNSGQAVLLHCKPDIT